MASANAGPVACYNSGGAPNATPLRRVDEDALTTAIIALAGQYGRYGYRRVTALLNQEGWAVGKDRVQRSGDGRD
jgi:putative transposase